MSHARTENPTPAVAADPPDRQNLVHADAPLRVRREPHVGEARRHEGRVGRVDEATDFVVEIIQLVRVLDQASRFQIPFERDAVEESGNFNLGDNRGQKIFQHCEMGTFPQKKKVKVKFCGGESLWHHFHAKCPSFILNKDCPVPFGRQ